ncbi:ATP-binding protein [Candidatus Saganbacteria bacterium]|nr:ATP-binding protein [Candidatus Saganbacteria bacterium]
MIARQLKYWLDEVAKYPQIIHILGLRQTGKTTLMDAFRQNYPGALNYQFYDLVTLRRYESRPEQWVLDVEAEFAKRGLDEILHVFVDEIQKIPALFQGLQGLYEKHKGRIKFWIWGSSARPIKRQRAETLAGRSFSKVLWPLSQSEILGANSIVPVLFDPDKLEKSLNFQEPRDYATSLSSWLQKTMLPEPNLQSDITLSQELLQSYQATYLENEIRRENLVQDIGLFDRFLALAASENTFIASYAAKAKVLGVSPHTIKTYYGILEDTFVCQSLPPYSKSLRVQISKSPKIYFSDAGLARFVAGERGLPDNNTAAFGILLEGFVINEIFKQIEYHSLPWKLSYLRTKAGMEIDLIISRGKEKIAAEIKATRKITPEDYQSILSLMQMDPDVKYGIVFSRQSAPFKIAPNIYNFPIWNL